MTQTQPKCNNCDSQGWVCENHPDRPWDSDRDDACTCGAGMPCPECNPSEGYHDPPRGLPGETIIWDRERGYLH